MKVDYVFILAAGKGSRMGEIGKKVPKVLWPIFEKSLLELQVAYAKYLAPSAKIYINIYNYKTSLLEFIDRNQASFKDVCFIVEESTLDIGGAIHNLANKNDYKGVSLILNSDQFLFCEKEIISQALKNLNNFAHTLFSYDVLTSQGYNALQVRDDCLQGITINKDITNQKVISTYTGMSLINFENLSVQPGESRFFDSVATCKTQRIGVEKILNFEYWDFGTSRRYYEAMFKILKDSTSTFLEFLINENAINPELIGENSYNGLEGITLAEFSLNKGQISYLDNVDLID